MLQPSELFNWKYWFLQRKGWLKRKSRWTEVRFLYYGWVGGGLAGGNRRGEQTVLSVLNRPEQKHHQDRKTCPLFQLYKKQNMTVKFGLASAQPLSLCCSLAAARSSFSLPQAGSFLNLEVLWFLYANHWARERELSAVLSCCWGSLFERVFSLVNKIIFVLLCRFKTEKKEYRIVNAAIWSWIQCCHLQLFQYGTCLFPC